MRKEAEILLKQISEVVSKIISVSDYQKIEELISIYYNFFDQLLSILKEQSFEDIAKDLSDLHLKLINYLEMKKLRIREEIIKSNRKDSVENKFGSKEVISFFDKKV